MSPPKAAAPSAPVTPRVGLKEGRLHALFGYQLAQASILTTGCFVSVVGKPLDLRKVEFTALQLIAENGGATATRIARALGITVPGITVWLDRLEARRLIVRERSGTDRRTQHLRTTDEGERVVGQALGLLLAAESALLGHLTLGERQLLLELLHKVARSAPA